MRITHFVAAACLVSIAAAVAAQTATVQTAKVNYSVQPVDSQGLTLEPYALSEGLIRELRRGGYVLYLRHGPVQVGSMDNKGAANWWKTCANTQKLAPQAFNLGVTIGIALNTQKVPVEEVLTSELCRAYDSGVFLGLVTPKMIPALNPAIVFESQKKTLAEQVAGVQKLLSEPPSAGKNRVLVGHTLPPTVIHPILSTLQEAHTAIFRAEGNGRFHLVTVLSPGQWASINTLTVTDKPSAVAANAVVTTTAATPVPAAPPPPPALPLIDPTKELKGAI
ncbi:MAG: hypothetical protein JNM52_03590, partial [Betaproteobacteria bacterium]|nr:hypothetical protein [Betaproteobacteria bacterium]